MIWVLAPFLNERENLPGVLENWRKIGRQASLPLQFLFVDDGSNDGGGELIKSEPDVEVIRHSNPKGPGAAFTTGFEALFPRIADDDVVFTTEADNTSDPEIALEMMRRLENGADLVLSACYAPGGGIEGTTFLRKLLSSTANIMVRTLFALPELTTFTSFYRAYRPSLLRKIARGGGLHFRTTGFVCMAELLLRAVNVGARVEEVPMILACGKRKGKSKMRIGRTISEYGFVLWATFGEWFPRFIRIRR